MGKQCSSALWPLFLSDGPGKEANAIIHAAIDSLPELANMKTVLHSSMPVKQDSNDSYLQCTGLMLLSTNQSTTSLVISFLVSGWQQKRIDYWLCLLQPAHPPGSSTLATES